MLIAITGKAGSGKSEAIEVFKELGAGRPVFNIKFAYYLYTAQEYLYRLVAPAYTRPKDFVKDRKLLQFLGTEWARSLDQDIWVKMFKNRVAEVQKRDKDIIITCDDCRYENEAQAIHALGGVIVKITSDRTAYIGGIPNHASEAGFDAKYVDFEISNNGTLEEYHEALRKLFGRIKQELEGEQSDGV